MLFGSPPAADAGHVDDIECENDYSFLHVNLYQNKRAM
jgi:hypothetical protein